MVIIVSVSCLTVFAVKKHLAGDNPRTDKPRQASPASRAAVKNTTGTGYSHMESSLFARLTELEARPSDITETFSAEENNLTVRASLPKGKPFEWVLLRLSVAVEGTQYRVADCSADDKKRSCTLQFSSSLKKEPRVTLLVTCSDRYFSGTAMMAVIIENLEVTTYQIAVSTLSLPEPISVSITPAGKKASLMAQLAVQYNKEVIVRLPLEPTGSMPHAFEQSTVMVHYTREAIHKIILDAVRNIPNPKGFSNLWGSRACEDSRTMAMVLDETKKQRCYFAEAPATKNSVAASMAASIGIPYGEIGARLEKTSAPDIIAEVKRYAATAQAKGSVIVRASASKQLSDALKAAIPYLKQNGIQLVFVSELVK
jgi:polysaccharide deacetylase 2 family uncharacterized protein YibQ